MDGGQKGREHRLDAYRCKVRHLDVSSNADTLLFKGVDKALLGSQQNPVIRSHVNTPCKSI